MSAQNSKPRTQRNRGKLNLSKCEFCRKDKQRCEPVTRVWPQKCLRCENKGFPCCPNTRKRTRTLGFEHLVLGSQQQGLSATLLLASSLRQRTSGPVSASNTSFPNLTTLSNAVSLYKILQRGAFEAERQYQHLARIAESFDEIDDCNSHIDKAARNLRACLLNIISIRPEDPAGPAFGEGRLILRMLTRDLLENCLPVGSSRYGSRDISRPGKLPLTTESTIAMMEGAGEVGAALLLNDEILEQSARSEAVTTLITSLTEDSWRLQDKLLGMTFILEQELGLERPLGLPAMSHRLIVFDNSHWMGLLDMPTYWGYQDCLGSTVLHFLIEHLDSGINGITSPISSDKRAQFITRIASQDLSNYRLTDNYNRTPLHIAAQWNVLDVATALLKSGMQPDIVTNTNRTSLHYAASLGHTELCRILLEHGANVNAQTTGGNTPLMLALLRQPADDTYKLILEHADALLEVVNCQGDNALHLAVIQGNFEAVEGLLLEWGDLINNKNNDGETALCLAAQLEKKEDAVRMVEILLQSDMIDPSLQDSLGMTPLHHAACLGNIGVCNLLGKRNVIDGGLC